MNELVLFAQEAAAASESGFTSFLSRIDQSDVIPLVAIVFGCSTGMVIAVIAIISGTLSKWRHASLRSRMIQDMLDRGLSPAEIKELVSLTGEGSVAFKGQAGATSNVASASIPPAKQMAATR